MRADKAGARTAAKELIRLFAVKTPPVPIERIARAMKIRVQYAPLDGDLSGMAAIQDGVPVIGINALHHPNRQRFTLAHEIGHLTLHRNLIEGSVHVDKQILHRDIMTETGTDWREIEANAFASELLMPEPLLQAQSSAGGIAFEDDEAITSLAAKFRVSEAAMRFRLFGPGHR
jgi:Zn-dependent peptidase ImmA (M78 family)